MKKVLVILFLVFPSIALALPEETGRITHLQVFQDHSGSSDSATRYILKLDSTISENNCASDVWTGYLKNNADSAAYSTLLAMLISDREVKIQATNSDNCVGNQLLIRNVYPEW